MPGTIGFGEDSFIRKIGKRQFLGAVHVGVKLDLGVDKGFAGVVGDDAADARARFHGDVVAWEEISFEGIVLKNDRGGDAAGGAADGADHGEFGGEIERK